MKKYSLLFIISLAFTACQKEEKVKTPDFDVQAETLEVGVGETVNFNFSGSPDFINFYSGERGNDYEFRLGRVEDVDVLLSFESQIINNRSGTQGDQLSVLISTDFNGKMNIGNIELADWKDVTSRFRMAQLNENNLWIPSNKVNISSFLEDDKPAYIAFRYLTKPKTQAGVSPNFNRVRSFLLESLKDGETKTLATHANAGITPPKAFIRSASYQNGRGTLESTYINFYGNTSADTNGDGIPDDDVLTSAWVITNPLNLGKTADFGIDKAISVKTVIDVTKKKYSYTYTKPGNYQAIFIAKNANVFDEKSVIKQINITVLP